MRRVVVTGVIAAMFCVPVSAHAATNGRIIGGTKVDRATYDARWSSMVSLIAGGADDPASGHMCGGVLIADRIVLTARHCVDMGGSMLSDQAFWVRGGAPSLKQMRDGRQPGYVDEIFMMPGRDGSWFRDNGDLAIVSLIWPVHASPATLAAPEHATWWGDGLGRETGIHAAGWGITRDADIERELDYGAPPVDLHEADMPLLAPDACASLAPRVPGVRDQLCVGVPRTRAGGPARSACFGDSGGPLLADDPNGLEPPRVIGIASLVTGGVCGSGPSIYANVAAHRDWIDSVVARIEQSRTLRDVDLVRVRTIRRGEVLLSGFPSGNKDMWIFEAKGSESDIWYELRRGRGSIGRIVLPPTRDSYIALRVRRVDVNGIDQVVTTTGTRTRVDDQPPRAVAALRQRRVGVTHRLSWTLPRDVGDRVVGFYLEQRPAGRGRWTYEGVIDCAGCRARASVRPQLKSEHILLPGKREFRIAAFDRAGNYSPWTLGQSSTR